MIENIISNLSVYLQDSVLLALLAAYLGGIVISFTPCTYPLIPVTIGFIGARSSSSKLRGFLLSLFYFGRSRGSIRQAFRANADNALGIFYYGKSVSYHGLVHARCF
jgi:cytochrome c biogenesis protein CcdA